MVLTFSASAQIQLGRIKAARVTGEVKKISGGVTIELKNTMELTEADTVVTGKDSSVVLIFENASTVRVGADSKLEVKEFKIDPLDEAIEPSKLEKEPTKSKTELALTYGEMVGDVKHLNASSTYSIKTPVGAAGIRGTKYRIVFRPTSDGKAFTFTLSTAEGLVLFEGSTSGSGAPVEVAQDKEVVMQVDVAADGTYSVATPAAATGISSEAQTQISAAVTESVTALETTSFKTGTGGSTETTQPTTETTTTPTPAATDTGTPPPVVVPPPASLTPGAGK